MNIIIPMAGLGKRFADSGFTMPKPLIEVAGKLMYQWAVDCLPLDLATNLVFILRENECSQSLIKDIEKKYSNYPYSIVTLDEATQGQAETVLKAAKKLDLNTPSLIHNCDTYMLLPSSFKELNCDGAMVLFNSNEARWSYAKLNENNTKVVEVQKKKVISNNASTGTYFFKDTQRLLSDIQTLIDQNLRENNEYYLSSVYSLMLKKEKNIIPLWCDKMLCFGTPQDLVDSLNQMIAF